MRQNLFDAAFLFCAFAGGSLVLAGAGVVGLGLVCWAGDIWRNRMWKSLTTATPGFWPFWFGCILGGSFGIAICHVYR